MLGIVAVAITYFAEIFIDNTTARLRWQSALQSGWGAAAILGFANLVIIAYIMGGV